MTLLNKTHVFFDSQCPACSREVRLYKRLDNKALVEWVDLQTQRKLVKALGVNYHKAMHLLHVLDKHGKRHVGIYAHIQMWSQLPYFCHIANVLQRLPIVVRALDGLYRLLTRFRPGLVRAKNRVGGGYDKGC